MALSYERRDHWITSSASAGDRRPAEQRDELAPSYLIELHSVPRSQAGLQDVIGRGQSAGTFDSTSAAACCNVRFCRALPAKPSYQAPAAGPDWISRDQA